jgi:methylated-DNA-[protein]-cysteine S-methyltransferase
MMDCERFKEFQLSAILGDASSEERSWAAGHAKKCPSCRAAVDRDRWLEAAFLIEPQSAERGFAGAHRRLAQMFKQRRAYCCQVDGPFGPVYLARTDRGVCRVSFRRTEDDFMRELERRELLPDWASSKLTREMSELEGYFEGRSKRFRVPIDLRWVTPFQRKVLNATARVPFGEVVSYSDIARRIGNPAARRAVGGALGKNPVAIVIPCHRVVAADGSIGGYTGGLDIKRALMRIEGISLEEKS